MKKYKIQNRSPKIYHACIIRPSVLYITPIERGIGAVGYSVDTVVTLN